MKNLSEYNKLRAKEQYYNCTTIDDAQEFDRIFKEIMDNKSGYMFRSVNEARFKLYSSAQRQWIWNSLLNNYPSYKDYINRRVDQVKSHQHIMSFFYNNHIPLNDFVVLALLQHYGQPSPLVDFTYNPLLSLFFAFDNVKPGTTEDEIGNYVSLYRMKYTQPCFCSIQAVNAQGADTLNEELQKLNIPIAQVNAGKALFNIQNLTYNEYANIEFVLVHGDTSTTFVTALACFYLQVPVGHVEAGLRTYDIYSPWPEEMNRQITSRIATYNFSPTPLSEKNLKEEKVHGNIYVTGNTVIDALHMVVEKLKNDVTLAAKQEQMLAKAGYDVARLADGKKLVLITGHRRENFGEGFINMVTAIKNLTEKYPNVDFVYPMHLNPNVRKPIHEVFGENLSDLGNMFFIEPLQYLEFIYLMEKSTIVLTDSGGIQEEAPGLGKPVLVMRDTTERPEALESGTVRLVGTNHDLIVEEVSTLLDNQSVYDKMSRAVNPYGDGKACDRIVYALRNR